MENDIECAMHVTHIEGSMYRDSYRGYNVWSLICRVQGMESHI